MLWLIRRLFWFVTGAGMGFGGALWIRRRFHRLASRYAPQSGFGSGMRRVRHDIAKAFGEGRAAMRSREAELRAELAPTARRG